MIGLTVNICTIEALILDLIAPHRKTVASLTTLTTGANMKTTQFKSFVRQPYAWPGGYPLFAIATDGGCICKACAKDNAKLIIRETRDDSRSGWAIAAVEVNWEDAELTCDNCGNSIESAYA